VAGVFTARYEPLTDHSVAERLRACGPWVKALLRRMLPPAPVAGLPEGKRFLAIEGSTVQAPGATGTDPRLPLCLELVSLELVEVLVTDVHRGETLKHCALGPGAVAVADRGYAHPQGLSVAVQQGADLLVRLKPFSGVLCTPTGQPLALSRALKRQRTATIRTLPVLIRSACGRHEVRGWRHAYRLSAEHANRARQKCRQRHKKGAPQAETLWLAGWGVVFTTLTPAGLSAQTILAVYRCRWQIEIAIKRWTSGLAVDAVRAKAHSPLAEVWRQGKLVYALMLERRRRRTLDDRWGRLDQERVRTWWRLWGMCEDTLAPLITGALCWQEEAWAACLQVVTERPRRRKLPQLPPEAVALLYCRDESKHEELPLAA
jgi:hypothetical protein